VRQKNFSEEVIQAFLTHSSTKDIASASGLSTKTVSRYKNDIEFQSILNERRLEYVKGAVHKMQMSMTECVDELIKIMRDKRNTPKMKVTVSQVIFNQCREWTMTTDILDRLQAIEEAQRSDS